MRTSSGLALVALALGSAAWVPTADFKQDSATHVWKGTVSGVAGTVFEYLAPYDRGLHKLVVWENVDDPYKISVYKNLLSSTTTSSGIGTTLESREVKLGSSSVETVDVGDSHYITAVQVCTNNNKIKGVRIWGRSLKNDGALNVAEIKSEYELPNCNGNWGAKVSCGDEKIATGIRAHAKEPWNGFSGLTLRCGKVIPK